MCYGTQFAPGSAPKNELVRTLSSHPLWHVQLTGNPRGRMSQAERFAHLLREFERVGVDPNTISAGLAVREEDVLRALAALPDNAGPAAFLSQLRRLVHQGAEPIEEGRHRDASF